MEAAGLALGVLKILQALPSSFVLPVFTFDNLTIEWYVVDCLALFVEGCALPDSLLRSLKSKPRAFPCFFVCLVSMPHPLTFTRLLTTPVVLIIHATAGADAAGVARANILYHAACIRGYSAQSVI